ncbi:MAG TPA: type II toxin-antitoxin system VapB family antitoxin [Actinomycetota bacterium]|jgi:Arc/MetJ family transcription regulator|nr:type II toxin-antitoxin system VapB family antitoxin [Actinomycetota bacterium]
MGRKVRTNIVIDEDLVARVMRLYGLRSRREAVDLALRYIAGTEERRRAMLALRGAGWEGDLDEIRRGEIPEL